MFANGTTNPQSPNKVDLSNLGKSNFLKIRKINGLIYNKTIYEKEKKNVADGTCLRGFSPPLK